MNFIWSSNFPVFLDFFLMGEKYLHLMWILLNSYFLVVELQEFFAKSFWSSSGDVWEALVLYLLFYEF